MVTVEFIAHVSWYFYVACQATLASATHSRCAFLRDAFVLSYAGVPLLLFPAARSVRYCSQLRGFGLDSCFCITRSPLLLNYRRELVTSHHLKHGSGGFYAYRGRSSLFLSLRQLRFHAGFSALRYPAVSCLVLR